MYRLVVGIHVHGDFVLQRISLTYIEPVQHEILEQ
jgi:hypothetical protein